MYLGGKKNNNTKITYLGQKHTYFYINFFS